MGRSAGGLRLRAARSSPSALAAARRVRDLPGDLVRVIVALRDLLARAQGKLVLADDVAVNEGARFVGVLQGAGGGGHRPEVLEPLPGGVDVRLALAARRIRVPDDHRTGANPGREAGTVGLEAAVLDVHDAAEVAAEVLLDHRLGVPEDGAGDDHLRVVAHAGPGQGGLEELRLGRLRPRGHHAGAEHRAEELPAAGAARLHKGLGGAEAHHGGQGGAGHGAPAHGLGDSHHCDGGATTGSRRGDAGVAGSEPLSVLEPPVVVV
mmetsp:Transcript_1173/g.2402  ORF Transcript_1173/g.2402 Transcript_1173/m.2402 type:complete len:265 (+) Transcript_1173:246-1040(+)